MRCRFMQARSAICLFRFAVVSSRYIVCLLKNIQIRSMKFAKRYLKFYTLLFKNNFIQYKMTGESSPAEGYITVQSRNACHTCIN